MRECHSLPPSLGEIEAMARAAFAALPAAFRVPCAGLVIRVADFATDDVLDGLEIDNAWALSGLYQGIPLTEKSVAHSGTLPDTIWLYRCPILNEWIERGDVALAELVTHVLVHEIAHHFGFSDADIAQIDRWWE